MIEATDYELEPTPWIERAACRGIAEPDLFFPERGGSEGREAKAVCADCAVRAECLEYAVRWRIDQGIWGGLSARERRRRYRSSNPPGAKRLPPHHGTTSRYNVGCHCDRCLEAHTASSLERRDGTRSQRDTS